MELNQGHMDFQSIALPPELRYHGFENCRFRYCECKGIAFFETPQIFRKKITSFKKKDVTLHPQ